MQFIENIVKNELIDGKAEEVKSHWFSFLDYGQLTPV